ncbi:DNA-directed RNA polymerase subunit beta [Patescibacteria group bacterium]|nr:DNA-directed RNA polymerase subunit beta [Patescibacteria group bacterium]MCG2694840.1 DNA-directed RNA polymerase subunit beta [Candidatus Parcubacteria bacterium]
MSTQNKLEKKYFSKFKEPLVELPDMVEPQINSYKWFVEKGINEILGEFASIKDYSEKKFELQFKSFELAKPEHDEFYAKDNKLSYTVSLKARVKLKNKTLNSEKEQDIFLVDFPIMTDHGTFIINGVERVVVPQLARSFGVFFTAQEIKGKKYFGAKIIPSRGAWIEIESDADGVIYVRIDRKRKFPISSLLRIFGAGENLLSLFKNPDVKKSIEASMNKDVAKDTDSSYIEIYRRLRDGGMVAAGHAKDFVASILTKEKYDLSEVGRFYFNKRFENSVDKKTLEERTLSLEDLKLIINHIVELNLTPDSTEDDIDDLGSRRIRYFGEMIQQKFRVGMLQMKRNIQDRMSIIDVESVLPVQLISPRPLQARIKEFYTTNQLSQFMQQDNILYELEHLRTVSALGAGGLVRERASFEVRDVHPSHYGRLCPIQTPEGQNIGLILRLASYAKINAYGMVETPYAKVEKGKITKEIIYLNASTEKRYNIAHSAINYDSKGSILDKKVEVRKRGKPSLIERNKVDFIDVAANQAFSVATSMIPFVNHDDANRALMGSNMQKQATPCILPEAPLVATGIEEKAARDTGRLLLAEESGVISYVDAKKIKVKNSAGKEKEYRLINFSRTNAFSVFHHRPSVDLGQKVKKGDVLADVSSSANGQIAIGQNCLIAFMSWSGANYEDAIILSERMVKDHKFTSIHVEEFMENVRDTKLGAEVTTHDIPNVSESKLKDLDEEGIIRIGAEVGPGDILVGKITPKGETQLTPEERLLRSIFGEKARDVKDTSLRMPGGKKGRVVSVKVFARDKGETNESGVIKKIYIEIAELRNISVGDKLAGRHGNKGVISRILPVEDMPHMEDGTPVDVILTPLGVPSRMNLGQILELHLGLAAHTLNYQAIVPPFMGATDVEIKEELKKAGFNENGKIPLIDGRTGERFNQDIAVGYMYILKLHHMVEDKIHMRSVGPYSLINQQPLGGKAQGGGQRFGEMEVWALLGHGAAYTLREVLTIKSDDILGRSAAFDAIIKGQRIPDPNIPASFNVLLKNLKGLALDIEMVKRGNKE